MTTPEFEELETIRLLEAALFIASEPMEEGDLALLPGISGAIKPLLQRLASHYKGRGVQLECTGSRWAFRTSPDLAHRLKIEKTTVRKPGRAALETLAIVAYHQPVTRGDIEAIRGVAVAKGTLDFLLESGWIKPRGRRDTPGRPLQWGTTQAFLDFFGLSSLRDLPNNQELKAAGLLDLDIVGTPLATVQQESNDDDQDKMDVFDAGMARVTASHMDHDKSADNELGDELGADG